MSVDAYLEAEYAALLSHPLVASAELVKLTTNRLSGYLRVRCALTNGHYLEAAVHITLQHDSILIDDYRYQWLDADRGLVRRWDNAPHYPGVPGFPHHCHLGREDRVEPGVIMDLSEIVELIATLTQQVDM